VSARPWQGRETLSRASILSGRVQAKPGTAGGAGSGECDPDGLLVFGVAGVEHEQVVGVLCGDLPTDMRGQLFQQVPVARRRS
jgi:hypothetical protein